MFILDEGLKIFIWCGSKSRVNDRSKGRLVADRINKLERKNKAQLSMFRAVLSESQTKSTESATLIIEN